MVDTPDMSNYITKQEAMRLVADAVAKAKGSSGNAASSASLERTLTGLNGVISNNNGLSGKISSALGTFGSGGTGPLAKVTGILTGAAQMFMTVAEQANQSADSIFAMYNTGVVMRMDQLAESTSAFGVGIEGLTSLMTKHARVVSTMGIDRTNALGEAFRRASNNGTQFGMSLEQTNETFLTYAEILNNTGRLQLYNEKELTAAAKGFAEQLNLSAQLTGKNTEQLAQEIKLRQQESDVTFLRLHLSEEQNRQLDMLQQTLHNYGDVGDQMYTEMVKYMAGGMGRVDEQVAIGLGDAGRQYFQQMANAANPEEIANLMSSIGNVIKESPMGAAQLGGTLDAAARFQGAITSATTQVDNLRANLEEPGKAKPIDETAAYIRDVTQTFVSAAEQVKVSFNTLAVAGANVLKTQLQGAAEQADAAGTALSNWTNQLLKTPISEEDLKNIIETASQGITIASIGALVSSGMLAVTPELTAAGIGAGTAIGVGATSAAEEGIFARTFGRVLKAFGFAVAGQVSDQVGDVVQGTGYERTGAAISAAGEIGFNTLAGAKLAPGALKVPAALLGAGVGVYNQMDNLTSLFGGSAAANIPPTDLLPTEAGTTEVPTVPSTDQSEVITQQTDALVVPLEQIAESNNTKLAQDKLLMEQNALILEELKKLNENIDEQTTALRNAYSQGNGNIYPR